MSGNMVRSRFRALDAACLTCSGDLASIAALPGVTDVDPLASGLVLVTHDETVTDDTVIEAGRMSGVTLTAAGAARPLRS